MLQNVLRTLGGIEGYGIASLCLFITVFTAVLVWALLQRKSHLDRVARLPLDGEPESLSNPKNSYE
jgi:cbb3-type cytochrome oxidase subunit 3